MRLAKPPELKPLLQVLVLLAGGLLFSCAAVWTAEATRRAIRLKREGVETTARVTYVGGSGRRGHWVRYRFVVNGDPLPYHATKPFRSSVDAKIMVGKSRQDEARRTGAIRVRYAPSGPWINLPIDAAPMYADPWFNGILAGVHCVAALCCWAGFVFAMQSWRKSRRARHGVPPVADGVR